MTSEAMDGAAPELNPGWVHRRKNTCPEVRFATQLLMAITPQIKTFRNSWRMLQRASVVLPLTRHPGVMRALRHPWLRSPQHPHTAVDH
ncbi:hypothetical protein [Pseudomonas sp. C27(2019)]|uniref:hypothetical protein n=1 Tax=Pseudomonas sp. C27(2019) TaxID=2604941 RepID=UPI0015B4F9E9|nr:hypothetical protein [Pseudomonas sp. C27(2019)]